MALALAACPLDCNEDGLVSESGLALGLANVSPRAVFGCPIAGPQSTPTPTATTASRTSSAAPRLAVCSAKMWHHRQAGAVRSLTHCRDSISSVPNSAPTADLHRARWRPTPHGRGLGRILPRRAHASVPVRHHNLQSALDAAWLATAELCLRPAGGGLSRGRAAHPYPHAHAYQQHTYPGHAHPHLDCHAHSDGHGHSHRSHAHTYTGSLMRHCGLPRDRSGLLPVPWRFLSHCRLAGGTNTASARSISARSIR